VTALPKFMVLYAAMYAAYGVASPFLPSFLGSRGLSAEELGVVLGASTAIRLVSAPLAGRIGDLVQALRVVLVVSIAAAALVTLGYLSVTGFWLVLGLVLAHAAALAPMTVLADALALGASVRPPRFEYGWVRGTGSAAFILGTLLSGQAIGAFGLELIIPLQALLLGAAALAALLVAGAAAIGSRLDASGLALVVLSALALAAVVLRMIDRPEELDPDVIGVPFEFEAGLEIGIWLALIGAVVQLVGALMRVRRAPEPAPTAPSPARGSPS
jgi:MFS family permease